MKIIPCIVGLGYVGLPIALALSRKFLTYGFDINLGLERWFKNY